MTKRSFMEPGQAPGEKSLTTLRRDLLSAAAILLAIPVPAEASPMPELVRIDVDWSGPIPPLDDEVPSATELGEHPDRVLLDKVARWEEMEAEGHRLFELEYEAEEAGNQAAADRYATMACDMVAPKAALRTQIFEIQPRTLDGLRAQARVIQTHYRDCEWSSEGLAVSFAQAVLNLTGGLAASKPFASRGDE